VSGEQIKAGTHLRCDLTDSS